MNTQPTDSDTKNPSSGESSSNSHGCQVVAMSRLLPSLILEHGVEEYQELPGRRENAQRTLVFGIRYGLEVRKRRRSFVANIDSRESRPSPGNKSKKTGGAELRAFLNCLNRTAKIAPDALAHFIGGPVIGGSVSLIE